MDEFRAPPGYAAVSLSVDFLLPGTVLGSELYDAAGAALHPAKTPLTAEVIGQFKQARIERVFYLKAEDPSSRVPAAAAGGKPLLEPRTMELAKAAALAVAADIRAGAFIQTTGVHQLVDVLLRELRLRRDFPAALLNEKKPADMFLGHSLNVTILSILVALRHGFEPALVKQIGIGAFLHDIGKLRLPRELLEKAAYTPEEMAEFKRHTTIGFELIKMNGQLSSIVRKIVLLHHEACDGTGYPLGLGEKDVGYYPHLVGICNLYDNLTTDRAHRKAFPARDALNMLVQASGRKLPPYLVQLFVKNTAAGVAGIPHFAAGDYVVLTTREIALVTEMNPRDALKPKVRIVRDAAGKTLAKGPVVALENDPDRRIQAVPDAEKQRQLGLAFGAPPAK